MIYSFFKAFSWFSNKSEKEAEKVYSEALTLALTEVNALNVGKKFELSENAESVLNFVILYKTKSFFALQIDLIKGYKSIPYMWLKINYATGTIQAIAFDKESFLAFSKGSDK